jgi:hypothetical protein
LPDDRLYLAALAAFNFVKSSSLLTKHDGFSEEKEWRIVYVPEGDPLGYLKACLDYFIGPRGLEPIVAARSILIHKDASTHRKGKFIRPRISIYNSAAPQM